MPACGTSPKADREPETWSGPQCSGHLPLSDLACCLKIGSVEGNAPRNRGRLARDPDDPAAQVLGVAPPRRDSLVTDGCAAGIGTIIDSVVLGLESTELVMDIDIAAVEKRLAATVDLQAVARGFALPCLLPPGAPSGSTHCGLCGWPVTGYRGPAGWRLRHL